MMLLGSDSSSDVIESILLLTRLQELNIEIAKKGTRKILVLFFNKDENIRQAALDSYLWLYLKPEKSIMQKAEALIDLLKDAGASDECCVE